MHFGLTDEQELLQQAVRDFARGDLPAAKLRVMFDEGTAFDDALWRGAAEVGIQGLAVPERFGGAGLELLDLALAFEVLGEVVLPGPFLGHALASLALTLGGSDAQRERWLPRLASGEVLASLAIAEAGDVWEASDWALSAAGGRLHGAKEFVEHADRAGLLVVGTVGGGLVLVEPGPALHSEPVDGVDRTRSLCRVTFANAAADPLPGGRDVAEAVLDAGRILLAADAFGAAWRLVRMTVDYALTREQFGTPLAQFQGVKHELANLAAHLEPTRGLFWYAAHAFEHMPEERPTSAAVAKAQITDVAVKTGRACIELHGGIGFTWECDVQFWAKRTMFDRSWLGNPQLHRERIATLEAF